MRTLQEKYNGIQEGTFSKDQFIREARMGHPNIISRVTGYDDAVQILKNKGMLSEVEFPKYKADKTPDYRFKPKQSEDEYSVEQLRRGIDVELANAKVEGIPSEEEYEKAKAKALKCLARDPLYYLRLLTGEKAPTKRVDQMKEVGTEFVDKDNAMKKAELKEGFKNLIKRILNENIEEDEDIYEMYGEESTDEEDFNATYNVLTSDEYIHDILPTIMSYDANSLSTLGEELSQKLGVEYRIVMAVLEKIGTEEMEKGDVNEGKKSLLDLLS